MAAVDWHYPAAIFSVALAVFLVVVAADPWGLFLGYVAYALVAIAAALVFVAARWLVQAGRAEGTHAAR